MRAKRGLWYQGGSEGNSGSGDEGGGGDCVDVPTHSLTAQQSEALKYYLHSPIGADLNVKEEGCENGHGLEIDSSRFRCSSSDDGCSRRTFSESSTE